VDSTIPADLLKLKARLEDWRATRKYTRQPIPDEFRQAAAEMARRYSPSRGASYFGQPLPQIAEEPSQPIASCENDWLTSGMI
jgi:hypothetical protein